MSILQVKDIPDELYEELRKIAKQEHRSISQQTIVAIKQHIHNHNSDRDAARSVSVSDEATRQARIDGMREVFARIDSRPTVELPADFPNVVEMLKEERGLRDDRLGL
jgi:hypothetical protein